jgi:predicted  nucleic acid-binding Zn-ribbon protein
VVPQPVRLLKVYCATCGYTARITQRWITRSGTPDCPACKVAMVVEVKTAKSSKVAPAVSDVDVTSPYRADIAAALAADDLAERVEAILEEPVSPEPSALAQLLSEL